MRPSPPETRRDDTVDTLHGQQVADPYRWLEDPDSADTRAWVKAQNEATRTHLDGLASRPWFHDWMTALVSRPRAGTPDKVGGKYVVTRNDGSHEQDLLHVADSVDDLREGGGSLLLDPNSFSEDGTSSLSACAASKDGAWLAYLVSDGGSDWQSIRLLRLDDPAHARSDEVVTNVKFSTATWLPDHSYLYLHFEVEGTGRGTDAEALPGGRLMQHRVGTSQSDDELVLEFPDDPRISCYPELSHDGRWVVVHISEGTSEKNRLWAFPVEQADGRCCLGTPVKVVDEAYAAFDFVRTDGDHLYLLTDHEAPLGKVVRVSLSGERAAFEDVLPESDSAIQHAQGAGDEIVVIHLVDAQPRVTRVGLDGQPTGSVPVQGGSVVAVNAEAGDPDVFLGLTSVAEPLTAYHLDLRDGSLTRLAGMAPGAGDWRGPGVVSERRRATSPDGTEVPYFLVRRADVGHDAPRPTLLYGYGGFNIPILADFRPVFAGWLAAGGVLAIANLRGGSEYGADWHEAGRLHRKQNVFDDFSAVADHLVEQGVTTRQQLALHGGSNGGLLVGATMTQRPDLAAVALPAVGVMDMLRFHLFTIGAAWMPDFGDPEDPEFFATLRAYSPLHNVTDGTAYPATLVLTGDHDDRVVPAHSFKLTATLQGAQAGSAPVLARIETSVGHGLGKPASVIAAETADLLAFAAEHTGLQVPT